MESMQDIDKTRIAYVQQLEEKLAHATREINHYKPLAEKWTPQVHAVIDPATYETRITLHIGGKRITGVVSIADMAKNTPEDLAISVCKTLFENHVLQLLVDVTRVEMERIQPNAAAIVGASKW